MRFLLPLALLDVHSLEFGNGEIRGQIVPTVVPPSHASE